MTKQDALNLAIEALDEQAHETYTETEIGDPIVDNWIKLREDAINVLLSWKVGEIL